MSSSGSFKTSAYDGRYLLFSWEISSQNIANNTTTISWTLSGAGTASVGYYKAGNFKVVIDGKTVFNSSERINLYNGTVVKTGTYVFNHNSDGSKTFSASAQAGIYTMAANCTGSGSFTLNPIPRASTILSVSGNKITDKYSVKYSKAVSSYADTLQINVSGRAVSQKISNYVSGSAFSLSTALKKEIYSVNAQSANLEFQLVTYNGSTKIGTSDIIKKSVTVNDSQPIIGDISYIDTNSKTVAITGDSTKIIKGYSTVRATVVSVNAMNGATIQKIVSKIGDVTNTKTVTGSSLSNVAIDLGKVNVSEDSQLVITATDSRGLTATSSITVTACDYEKPTATITCKRMQNFYTETYLIANSHISDIYGKNTASIKAYTKEADATSYGSAINISDGEVTTLSLDNEKAWNVKVVVSDKLSSYTNVLYIEKGKPIIFVDREKSSVGINCFPKEDESLEVLGKNIYKELYYQPGDTVAISDIYCTGNTTSSNTKLYFSIPLAKSLDDVKSITLTEMKLNARHSTGGYTLSNEYVTGGYDVLSDSSITVTYDIKTGANVATFILSKTSAYNGINNTPETIQVHSIKFTCK